MRQALVLSLAGFFLSLVVVSFYNRSVASEGKSDERSKTIEDASISGRKTDVPLTKEMTDSLKKKEQELQEKERVLKEKEEAIAVEDLRVRQRIEELEALQEEVMKFQKKNSESADQQLKRLVKTMESMSPKKAAAMFMTMKEELAVELMMAMKEKKVAAVLELLEPDRANLLSSRIAQRRPAGRAVGEVGQASPKMRPSP